MATDTPADGESLYATLGVEPTASGESVRKAYRKLVLTCHPDKVRDASAKPEAERLFRQIVTAYEVLSDDVKRAEYDRRARLNGADVDDVLVNVTLKEALNGATKLAVVLEKKKCALCAGVGVRCESCGKCAGRRIDAKNQPCASCDGRGFGAPVPCDACRSSGMVESFFQGRVSVPAGVADGARVRVTGAKQRAKIRIMPSKLFERDGATIRSVLRLTAEQAEEGGFFEVETLTGTETIFLDGGVAHGDAETLEGKGLPVDGARGDHVVRVEVQRKKTPERDAGEEVAEPVTGGAGDDADGEGGGGVEDEREAKRAKIAPSASDTTSAEMDLAALLAAKKRALLAALEAKTAGGA